MTLDSYLQKALALVNEGNLIGAITTLEEARLKYPSKEILILLTQTQTRLRHMQDRKSYHDFYEKQQAKPKKYYNLGRRIERGVKGAFGIRTKRVIDGCIKNPRYLRVEEEIRRGNYKKILDVGCYEGHFSIGLGAQNPDTQIAGVDIASTNIKIANELNRYPNICFVQGFAEDVSNLFPAKSFDLIMLLEILEHVISVEEVLGAAFSVLKDGGRIVITVPAEEDHHDQSHDEHDEHVRFFSDDLIKGYFGNMPNLVVERIKLQQRQGKPAEWSSYITFTKP